MDEYHKLLETGKSNKKADKPSKKKSLLLPLLQNTVLHPLPWILKPETLVTLVSHTWILLCYIIYYLTPLATPLAIWFVLATPVAQKRVSLFAFSLFQKQQSKALPILDSLRERIPDDWRIRAGITAVTLLCFHIAQRAVAELARKKYENSRRALTHTDLWRYYTAYSSSRPTQNFASNLDEKGLIESVKALSAQYDGNSSSIATLKDAAVWIVQVGAEVGVNVDENSVHSVQGAADALTQITRAALA